MKPSFLLLFGWLFSIGCDNTEESSNLNASLSQPIKKPTLQENSYKYLTKISQGDYTLNIETTYLKDSLLNTDKNCNLDSIVLEQNLSFMYHDSTLMSYNSPVDKIDIQLSDGRKFSIVENVIQVAGVVNGEKGEFYYLRGSGQCIYSKKLKNLSEFETFCSIGGKMLWSFYNVRTPESEGNYYSILKSFAVPDSLFKSKKLLMIWVFPFEYNQQELKSSLSKF